MRSDAITFRKMLVDQTVPINHIHRTGTPSGRIMTDIVSIPIVLLGDLARANRVAFLDSPQSFRQNPKPDLTCIKHGNQEITLGVAEVSRLQRFISRVATRPPAAFAGVTGPDQVPWCPGGKTK